MEPKRKHKNIKMLIAAGVFLALTAVMALLSISVAVSEFWARTVSRGYRIAVASIFGLLPFSITEWLIAAVVVAVLSLIVAATVYLAKRQASRAATILIGGVLAASVIGCLYFATAGFEYKREPFSGPWSELYVEKETFLAMSRYYLTDMNTLAESLPRNTDGSIRSERSFQEIQALVANEFDELLGNGYLSNRPARAKPVVLSVPMAYLGISGLYLSITGEANINTVTPSVALPHTIAHELSHSLGVQRENDANVLAAYVTLNSEDIEIRYSGYMASFYQLLRGVGELFGYDSAQFAELSLGRSPLVVADATAAVAVWSKYDGWISDLSSWFNDVYLKLSGAKDGTGSYNTGDIEISETPIEDEGGANIEVTVNYSEVQKIFIDRYLRLN